MKILSHIDAVEKRTIDKKLAINKNSDIFILFYYDTVLNNYIKKKVTKNV